MKERKAPQKALTDTEYSASRRGPSGREDKDREKRKEAANGPGLQFLANSGATPLGENRFTSGMEPLFFSMVSIDQLHLTVNARMSIGGEK